MDPLISSAARALAAGDPLRALNLIALRDEAPALALRGIALAQLGDLDQARWLLKRAARAFVHKDAFAGARCVVAEAEIAFVSRDLGWPVNELAAARATLEAHGDALNAAHAGHLQARRFLLLGQLGDAEATLGTIDPSPLPAARRTAHELISAGLAIRRLRTDQAREAFDRAKKAARLSGILALAAEVEKAAQILDVPVARSISRGQQTLTDLDGVAALLASRTLIVDACRRVVRHGKVVVPLASRPVLFTLARALAEAWPGSVPRDSLIQCAFRTRVVNESHRVRLRVEVGRLRGLLKIIADVRATRPGFVLVPRRGTEVAVLAWPADEEHADVLAFLADGEAWSSSALALALGVSQRTVQRAIDALAAAGKVQPFGRGRARRWTTPPLPGFTTILLLPPSFPVG